MLDKWTHKGVQPPLTLIAQRCKGFGISASQVTVTGFILGMLSIPALAAGQYMLALALIALNRIMDGLDGNLARLTRPTDFGGFLDIVLDFIFYSGVLVGFALADPGQNAIAAIVLMFSFMGTGSSFLAYAAMAAKRGISENPSLPNKSLYYLGGLTEGTETITLFVLMCLFPAYFPELAYTFAFMCLLTTLSRIYTAHYQFERAPRPEDESLDEG